MSQVQGRVFDSSLYAFIADVAVSLSSSGYATTSYVDGSLAERDSSIEFLTEYEIIQDASINVLETAITNIDTSINDIWANQINQDSSISNLYTTKLTKTSTDYVSDVVTSLGTGQRLYDYKIDGPNGIYVVLKEVFNGGGIILTDASGAFSIKVNDASFALKTLFDSSISYLVLRENITDTSLNTLKLRVDNHDTSILLLNNWDISQDSSISTLRTRLNTTDTSLNTLNLRVDNHDTSINLINNWNIEQDISIAWCAANISGFPDASVNEIYSYVDGSLNLKVNKTLFDSSISALTVVNNNQDTSIGILNNWNISQDASLVLKLNSSDASTTYLRINDASTTYAQRLTSFLVKDVSYLASTTDNNNIIFADTSLMYIIFPNTLPIGWQTTVVNRTTGNITLNASTFYTTDSSVVLRDQYAAASVVCSSTGVFYGFGNLK